MQISRRNPRAREAHDRAQDLGQDTSDGAAAVLGATEQIDPVGRILVATMFSLAIGRLLVRVWPEENRTHSQGIEILGTIFSR